MEQRDYQIVDKSNSKKLTEFFCPEGQLLRPLVELITHTEMALDELVDVTGRAASRPCRPSRLTSRPAPGQTTQRGGVPG